MIRLHFVVEGQTEEEFVNSTLVDHLGKFNIVTVARCVETSRRRAVIYRGGMLDYGRVKRDLLRWMKEDQNPDAYFTTMLDLHALPRNFPEYTEAQRHADPYQRIAHLEDAFQKDVGDRRFVPHLQLYEFEAMLLADPSKFNSEFLQHEEAIQNLIDECGSYTSPELINDGPDTAPSKRIIREIPEYEGMKVSAGPRIAAKIGLELIREKCPHFDSWLSKLESLGEDH